MDLGKWLKEEHQISAPLRPEHFEEFTDLPPESSEKNEEKEWPRH